MAVREFDGVDDNIVCATGALSGMQFGTVAVLVQRRATGDFYALMGVNSSTNTLLGSVLIWNNNTWTWFTSGGGAKGHASPGTTWALLVARKATGTAIPRFSAYNYAAASWTHQAGSATQGNWTAPGTDGNIAFSDAANDFPAIRVAARAAWANTLPWSADATGDAAIESAGLEDALANWLAASPSALWRFNQDATTDPVLDITGGGADQTAITGTAVVVGDDPPGFDFSTGTEIAADEASHPHAADQPGLTQVHVLTVNPASHGHTVNQPTVTQAHQLTVDSTTHSHTAELPSLAQAHLLAADDATHSHTADELTVAVPGQVIIRPDTGVIAQPDSGTIVRPFTGIVSRP